MFDCLVAVEVIYMLQCRTWFTVVLPAVRGFAFAATGFIKLRRHLGLIRRGSQEKKRLVPMQ